MRDFSDKYQRTHIVGLLPLEQGMATFGHAQAMSTLTWFQGDTQKATALLKERSTALLKANPWLTGRVRKTNAHKDGVGKKEWALVYRDYDPKKSTITMDETEKEEEQDIYFRVIPNVVSRDVPLVDLGSKLKDYIPKNGPDQRLWRVSVCPCSKNPSTRFAVVVSLSHIVGDGHTFFQLSNLVLAGSDDSQLETPFALDRIKTTEAQQIQALGGEKDYGIVFSPGFIANFVRGNIHATVSKKHKAQAKIYLVDPEGMGQAKQDALVAEALKQSHGNSDQPEFVSSNDVLTSWFFQNSSCSLGFMNINFRGRLEGHTDRHAGNYEGNICYPRADSKSPGLIRTSLDTKSGLYQRSVTRHKPLPGFWKLAFRSSFAVCSNWASFARPSNLGEGFIEEVQVPLYEVVVPSTGVVCIVFRAGPKGLAVILAGSKYKLEGLEKDVPFLKPYSD